MLALSPSYFLPLLPRHEKALGCLILLHSHYILGFSLSSQPILIIFIQTHENVQVLSTVIMASNTIALKRSQYLGAIQLMNEGKL